MKTQTNAKKNAPKSPAVAAKKSLSYEDFIALFFIAAFLVIDFMPYFGAYEIIAPQFIYLATLNTIIGVYIYGSASLQTKAIIHIFKKSYIFKLYLLFILLCFFSVFFSANISLSILSLAEILIVLSMVLNFTILLYGRLHLLGHVCLLIGVSALFQAGKVLFEFNNIAKSASLKDAFSSNVLKGNAGNINILAASLGIKIPFLLYGVVSAKQWRLWLYSLAMAFCFAVIFLINARASVFSLLIIIAFFSIYYLKSNWSKAALLRFSLIIIPLFLSYLLVNRLFEKSAMSDRFTSTLGRLSNTQTESSGRRIQIWKAGIGLAKDHPVTGVGIGNYRVESIPYDLSTNATIPLHAHNDFLEIASETGVLNGLIYFAVFALLLFVNVKRLFKNHSKESKDVALVTLMILVVYGVDIMVNFPMYRPTMAIAFSFIMAFTFVNVGKKEEEEVNKVKNPWFIGMVLLAVIPMYAVYSAYEASVLEGQIQADDINTNAKGKLTGEEVLKRLPSIPNVFNTSESFIEYAGIYFLREKNYAEAIKQLDIANTINPYLGRPDFSKSVVAQEKGDLDSAYIYNKIAFYRRPINETFYQRGLYFAASKRDTVEISKMYHAYTKHIKDPKVWVLAYNALQNANVSAKTLDGFVAESKVTFPKDTVVSEALNAKTITGLIIEAQALTHKGDFDGAMVNYKKGLALEPNNVFVNQNLGFHYFNLKDFKAAASYFVKSLAKPGLTGGKTEYYLSLSLFNVGNRDEACKYAALAKTMGYEGADALTKQYYCY